MNLNDKVAARIKQIRDEKNISQAAIAKKMGISNSAYSRLENGEVQLTLLALEQISEGLEVSLSELLGINSSVNYIYDNQLCPIQYGTLNITLTTEEFKNIFSEILNKEKKAVTAKR